MYSITHIKAVNEKYNIHWRRMSLFIIGVIWTMICGYLAYKLINPPLGGWTGQDK